jgi:hypothetical protein
MSRSRAMAVAAEIDQVMLINLKRWKRIRREVEQPAGLDPDRYRPIKQVSQRINILQLQRTRLTQS